MNHGLLPGRGLDYEWLIDQLRGVSPGNLRALWLPHSTDTTTNILKPDGRVWTYGNPGGLVSNSNATTDATTLTAVIGVGTTRTRVTTDGKFDSTCFEWSVAAGAYTAGMRWLGTGDNTGYGDAGIAVTAGTAYTFSLYVKKVSASAAYNIRIRISWYTAAGAFISTSNGDATALDSLTDFTRMTLTATAPGTATTCSVEIVNIAGSETFVARLGGVRFEAGSSATAFGANISYQGNGILVSFNGTDQYATTPDTDDLSFGDGTTDSPFSIVALANITNTAANRGLVAKYSGVGAATQEYLFYIVSDDTLRLLIDSAVPASAFRTSDAAITQGALGLFGATYTAATGGATAANDITLYQNGAVIASTATNNSGGTYTAMSNTGRLVEFGAWGAANTLPGSAGFAAIYAAALTASQHLQIKTITNEFYGLAL